MYRKLVEEEQDREDFQERPLNFFRAAGAIPIHVEKALPFANAEGEEIHLFALDHDVFKWKADQTQEEEPRRWWSPPRFEVGDWLKKEMLRPLTPPL